MRSASPTRGRATSRPSSRSLGTTRRAAKGGDGRQDRAVARPVTGAQLQHFLQRFDGKPGDAQAHCDELLVNVVTTAVAADEHRALDVLRSGASARVSALLGNLHVLGLEGRARQGARAGATRSRARRPTAAPCSSRRRSRWRWAWARATRPRPRCCCAPRLRARRQRVARDHQGADGVPRVQVRQGVRARARDAPGAGDAHPVAVAQGRVPAAAHQARAHAAVVLADDVGRRERRVLLLQRQGADLDVGGAERAVPADGARPLHAAARARVALARPRQAARGPPARARHVHGVQGRRGARFCNSCDPPRFEGLGRSGATGRGGLLQVLRVAPQRLGRVPQARVHHHEEVRRAPLRCCVCADSFATRHCHGSAGTHCVANFCARLLEDDAPARQARAARVDGLRRGRARVRHVRAQVAVQHCVQYQRRPVQVVLATRTAKARRRATPSRRSSRSTIPRTARSCARRAARARRRRTTSGGTTRRGAASAKRPCATRAPPSTRRSRVRNSFRVNSVFGRDRRRQRTRPSASCAAAGPKEKDGTKNSFTRCIQCGDVYCTNKWMGNPGCFAKHHAKGHLEGTSRSRTRTWTSSRRTRPSSSGCARRRRRRRRKREGAHPAARGARARAARGPEPTASVRLASPRRRSTPRP